MSQRNPFSNLVTEYSLLAQRLKCIPVFSCGMSERWYHWGGWDLCLTLIIRNIRQWLQFPLLCVWLIACLTLTHRKGILAITLRLVPAVKISSFIPDPFLQVEKRVILCSGEAKKRVEKIRTPDMPWHGDEGCGPCKTNTFCKMWKFSFPFSRKNKA
jgi:hypothetical protein